MRVRQVVKSARILLFCALYVSKDPLQGHRFFPQFDNIFLNIGNPLFKIAVIRFQLVNIGQASAYLIFVFLYLRGNWQ